MTWPGARQLEQSERITGGQRQHLLAFAPGQRRKTGIEQPLGSYVIERPETALWEPGQLGREVEAHSERGDHRDWIGLEPTPEEPEHRQRGRVDPLRVVDEQENRVPRRHVAEQGEHCERGQEDLRSTVRGAEGCSQCATLSVRECADPIEHRPQKLMKTRERRARLCLHSDDPENQPADPLGDRASLFEQR